MNKASRADLVSVSLESEFGVKSEFESEFGVKS